MSLFKRKDFDRHHKIFRSGEGFYSRVSQYKFLWFVLYEWEIF